MIDKKEESIGEVPGEVLEDTGEVEVQKKPVNMGAKKLNLSQFIAVSGVKPRDAFVAKKLLSNEEDMTVKKWKVKFDEKGILYN